VVGTFLNSFPLTLNGDVRLFRLRGLLIDKRRDELRRELGVELWGENEDAYTYGRPGGVDAEEVTLPLVPTDGRRMFAVRQALIAHCEGLHHETRAAAANELRVVGLSSPEIVDRFIIDSVLHLRISREVYAQANALLTVRHRTRWRCRGSLADADLAMVAPGHPVIRIAGTGPARGRVEEVVGEQVRLLSEGALVDASAGDYTLAVNSAFVARWRGSGVLQEIREAVGDITRGGQRNQYAIRDRFKRAGDELRSLGYKIPVAGGGSIEIGRHPVEVRFEVAP